MRNTGVIGDGKWGSKIIEILEKNSKLQFIANTKNNFRKVLNLAEWVFVSTPESSHYKIVKFLLKKKKNVFCEKPLTTNLEQAKELYIRAKKSKAKLYVSDVENFKKRHIKLRKNYKIYRASNSDFKYNNIINRWLYHDIYLLYSLNKQVKIYLKKIIKKNNKLLIELSQGKNNITIIYQENFKKKIYRHNKESLYKKNFNALEIMIKNVLNNKVNYKHNRKISLFCIYTITQIKKAIKCEYKNYFNYL